MTNAAKVHEFLNKAQTFYFLTTDGDQPKGRPFGFQMLVDDTLYFGCGTFKNVFKQLTANPKVEVLLTLKNSAPESARGHAADHGPVRSERLGDGPVLP